MLAYIYVKVPTNMSNRSIKLNTVKQANSDYLKNHTSSSESTNRILMIA